MQPEIGPAGAGNAIGLIYNHREAGKELNEAFSDECRPGARAAD